ncbi:mechanosensitive ion channel family protein [Aquibacillus koreensis]|uniref:Mechanosensitive ion channel family protein n=1 Tax=Aquibacillus koreensis TaxID=279446 RepID=A0A9X3WJ09_9BACI|nr:mechanosensitive ion channel family protein [Aquibacillus koreensis]MCT2538124.1 mechanosensitive ion channel family protein [Aquibacillus koreensis]MDC3420647.1 mechanosensitive ion channel family protein [Aquibacillus koreensis]
MDFLQNTYDIILDFLLTKGIRIALLIIVFLIVAPIGKKMISSTLDKAGSGERITEARAKTLEKLLLNVYSYVLFFIFVVMLFGIIELPIGPLLAGAGVLGLAIGFGAQGLVSDVVTGFFLLLERQLEVGEYVTTGGYNGIVEEIGLRTTKIRSFDGTLNFVPNRDIAGVSNHSRGTMRALVDIGISYDDNIDRAMEVLQQVCDEFKQDERFADGPDVLGVQSFGSSDVVLRILGQTENMQQFGAERDMRKRIKEAFDQAGIEIPYPHQVYVTKQANE